MSAPGAAPRERFSQRAGSYDLGRPRYPAALFDWYRERFRLSAESVVADIGAGTGLHTAGLVDDAKLIWAVEPNEAMRKKAESRFEQLEHVRVLAGSAEKTGVPTGSVDLVTAAQAFHWFDPAAFADEVGRLLSPGGAWALTWNVRDPEANRFTARFEGILHRWGKGYGDIRASWGNPDTVARFSQGPVERYHFENPLPLDLVSARANLASCSFMPQAGSAEAAQAQAALDALFEEEAVDGEVHLVYGTLAIAPSS